MILPTISKASKKDKISPSGLFFILFISRIVVCLANVQSLTFSTLAGDILISFVLSFFLTLIFCIPVALCVKKGKNVFDIKWLSYLYFVYFVFVGAVNIGRFSYFASSTLNPDVKLWMFAFFICICAFYGATLGIEALSRFSFFAFVLICMAVGVIFLVNLNQYEQINLYPIIKNSRREIFQNALYLSSNSAELAMLLCLAGKVNGKAIKSFGASVCASNLVAFLLLLFMLAVIGDAAVSNSFPLYTLFQVSKLTDFERLDILHISFWILAVFVKAVLCVYCAGTSINGFKNKHKCFFASVFTFICALILSAAGTAGSISPLITIAPYIIFCAVIPACVLIFKRKSEGDKLVEML